MARVNTVNIFTGEPIEYDLMPTLVGKSDHSPDNDRRVREWRPIYEVFANHREYKPVRATPEPQKQDDSKLLRMFGDSFESRFENIVSLLMIVAIVCIITWYKQ